MSLWKFINYWYFRYLLVTELYIVEKWEEIIIYIVFLIFFGMLSLLNNHVLLGLVTFALDKNTTSIYNTFTDVLSSLNILT